MQGQTRGEGCRAKVQEGVAGGHLELGQHGQQVVLGHAAEDAALQRSAALGEDAALARDVPGRVDVVPRDHAHRDACALACCHRVWHLFPHWVLHAAGTTLHSLPLLPEAHHLTMQQKEACSWDATGIAMACSERHHARVPAA
jgi:hypothetical protein